jgi:hypothetical protein
LKLASTAREKPGSLFMVPPVIGTTASGVPREELPTPIGESIVTWIVKAGSRMGKSAILCGGGDQEKIGRVELSKLVISIAG